MGSAALLKKKSTFLISKCISYAFDDSATVTGRSLIGGVLCKHGVASRCRCTTTPGILPAGLGGFA